MSSNKEIMEPTLASEAAELSQKTRLKNAEAEWLSQYRDWEQEQANQDVEYIDELPNRKPKKNPPSYKSVADAYGLVESTLRRRIQGLTKDRREAHVNQQKLTPGEEEALSKWIFLMASWNFPPAIWRVRQMANQLLQKKDPESDIGINWVQKFLARQPNLQSRYSTPLDADRANACKPERINSWFDLVESVIDKYEIKKTDSYNMDEKGFAVGCTGKFKIICAKYDLNAYMSQPGNRDWVSLLECVSADGAILPIFSIFKGKQNQKAWIETLMNEQGVAIGSCCTSSKGWTNNELCMDWFQSTFEPASRKRQVGKYRLLIVDGHSSHVSTSAILFCIEHDIILLCLPSHTTHILQPLDVSFFLPLSWAYKKQIMLKKKVTEGQGYIVTKPEFLEYYKVARNQTATVQNIQSAWVQSGLFPID